MGSRGSRMWSTMSQTFWILVISAIALFAFFVALGAFTPGQVVGLSLGVLALAVLWTLHAYWESRHRDDRHPEAIRNRERRGF